MHGIFDSRQYQEDTVELSTEQRIRELYRSYRYLFWVVILPTFLAIVYYVLIASNQYESEARYVVRSSRETASGTSGMGQAASIAGMSAQPDAMSVRDYLASHDAVEALSKKVDIVGIFSRPDIDFISRLRAVSPTPEALLDYYLDHVTVKLSPDSGITTLTVRAFRPSDALAINRELLKLGEARVNAMNRAAYQNAMLVAGQQVDDAQRELNNARAKTTRFRVAHGDPDPPSSAKAQAELVAGMEGALAQAQAQLASTGALIHRSSPQYTALASRVHALSAQVAEQKGRLAGNIEKGYAVNLGRYEQLVSGEESATKRYELALTAYDKAREQAAKQQLFIMRVVEPNLPIKSTYPRRLQIITTLFFALLLAYGIGWLIAAGVREHAA